MSTIKREEGELPRICKPDLIRLCHLQRTSIVVGRRRFDVMSLVHRAKRRQNALQPHFLKAFCHTFSTIRHAIENSECPSNFGRSTN